MQHPRPSTPPTRTRTSTRRASAVALALAGGLAFTPGAANAANNPGTGDTGFFTFRPADTVAGTQINVASGNALIRTRDLADGPLTYHVVVDRAYNSLAPNDFSILSPRWKFDVGPDTKLTVEPNQDATVAGPSGYRIRFERQTDGSYVAPDDFDGTLTKTANGWTLTRTSQNDEFGFDSNGTLTWTKDTELRDFTVQGTSAAGRTVLSSYGTNSGRRVNLSYNGDSLVRLMDDPASGHHSYRYTSGRLTEYENPLGQITTYGYDSNGFLDEIVEPGGTTVELDVLASGKINSITTTLPGGVPQTTSFVYTRRPYKTDVTAPDATRRTYAYDDDWRVTRDYDPDVVPTVTASGELRDLADDYVGPNRTYPLTVSADQPDGAGLRRLSVEQEDGTEIEGEDVPCTTTPFDLVCPTEHTTNLDIDFSSLSEGATTIRAAATDDEGHRETSDNWTVLVDKTPPSFVSDADPDPDPDELAEETDLLSSSTENASLVSWPSAVDPDLADGNPGSDIDHYRWRYRATSSGSWSAWNDTPDDQTDAHIDEALSHVELEVIPVDAVGNAGTAVEWAIDELAEDTGPAAEGTGPLPEDVPEPEFLDLDEYTAPEESEALVAEEPPEGDVAGRSAVPINEKYRCKQTWSPIQSFASGWVIGNCSQNTRVSAYRKTTFKNYPGAESEGKIWVAGSLPDGASFKGCGWLSVKARLNDWNVGSGNPLCKTYNRRNKAIFMFRATGPRPGQLPAPNTKKYPKYVIWATRARDSRGRMTEMEGYPAKVTAGCRAYANINPWRRNQTASGASITYEPGDTLRIRYLSRYEAMNPSTGKKDYWIMAQTYRKNTTPWLWIPRSCKVELQRPRP